MAEHENTRHQKAHVSTSPTPATPYFAEPDPGALAELGRYAAHNAIAGQANALLTHITTSVTLYFTVTGATWAVVSSNAISAEPSTLILILILHLLFSFGMWLGLRGVGNNLIQRLNFARWMGVEYWPHIELLGGPAYAWEGVPHIPNSRKDKPSWALEPETYAQWKKQKRNLFGVRWLDHRWRYRAKLWPSLRYQRFWAILPVFGFFMSAGLIYEVYRDGEVRKRICTAIAPALLNPVSSAPSDREKLDGAKFLFDKAACSVSDIVQKELVEPDQKGGNTQPPTSGQ